MIIVFVEIKVKLGCCQVVLNVIEKLIFVVLVEEGCGGYVLMIDVLI